MKKATGSGKYFWEFYSYDVNVKKNFSNFPIFTTWQHGDVFKHQVHAKLTTHRDRPPDPITPNKRAQAIWMHDVSILAVVIRALHWNLLC